MRERVVDSFRATLDQAGFEPIQTSELELVSQLERADTSFSPVFQPFEDDGSLVTLKPDGTLSVARAVASRLGVDDLPLNLRYDMKVFRRVRPGEARSRSIVQLGAEVIGRSGSEADADVVRYAVGVLSDLGVAGFTVALGSVKPLNALLSLPEVTPEFASAYLTEFHASDFVELDELVGAAGLPAAIAEALRRLPRLVGGIEVLDELEDVLEAAGCDNDTTADLRDVWSRLDIGNGSSRVTFDFSILDSFDYYTGIVFDIHMPGLPEPIGSGGRYDTLLGSFGLDAPAAGFALTLELLMEALEAEASTDAERPIRIAIPKGSLYPETVAFLAEAGLPVNGLDDPGRSLIIHAPGIDYVIVRPSDAPAFVAFGGADCGICGNDSLLEGDFDLMILSDLGFGTCRFIEAEPAWAAGRAEDNLSRVGFMKVATKYPRIAQRYYDAEGIQVEIVPLRGNIELGPIVGMTDRIVDITATGRTLRENDLVITGEVMPSTARFFANHSALRTDGRIRELAAKLGSLARNEDD